VADVSPAELRRSLAHLDEADRLTDLIHDEVVVQAMSNADEDAAFEPESAGSPLTLSRDTLVYAIIGIAVLAILALFFI
jgi:hypothetical protein